MGSAFTFTRWQARPGLIRAVGYLSLWLLCVSVYRAGLNGGFLFDDYPNLVADPDWKLTSLDWSSLKKAMFLGISSVGGRPLAMLTFSLNHYWTGMDPVPMKATGIALHGLNACLTFLFLKQLLRLHPMRPEASNDIAAWLIAAAWAMHPLQVSSVLYIVQRMEIGAHFFVLLSLIAYVAARRAQTEGRRAWPYFALCAIAILLGLGFKESALLVPGYAFLLELIFFHFSGGKAKNGAATAISGSRIWLGIYGAGLAIFLAAYFTFILPEALKPDTYASRDFDLGQRLLSQLHAIGLYVRWILLPIPQSYVFYYDNFPISTSLFSPMATLAGLCVAVAMAVAALSLRNKSPLIAFGIGWFFVAHFLTSNVIPLELVFEHRNYAASFGLVLAVGQLAVMATRKLHGDARITIGAVGLAMLVGLCSIQVRVWSDPTGLATSLASRNIGSARASYELGKHLLDKSGSDRSNPLWSLAEREFEHSASLPNSPPLADQALIIMYARAGRDVPPGIWTSFREKLTRHAVGPQELMSLHSVLSCRIGRNCKFDDNQLFQTFLTIIEKNPRSPEILTLYSNFAYTVIGEPDLAITVAEEAVKLAPNELQYQINLAKYLAAAGDRDARVRSIVGNVKARDPGGHFAAELVAIDKLMAAKALPKE